MNNYTTIEILEKGLTSMTKACDALIDQNKALVLEIKEIKQSIKATKAEIQTQK
jgi:hypothetical protein